VENAPPTPDILQLSGGLNQTYEVTLSEPIKDPLMAIVSLGSPAVRCTYDFDSPFTIVSQGVGYWGGSDHALTALPDDILEGYEGHGTIRFVGTFATFGWTVPTPESWHGFTFAIRTTEALEPTPEAGGAGGESATGDSGAAGAGVGGESAAGQGSGGAPSEGGSSPGTAGSEDEPRGTAGNGEGGESTRPYDGTRDEAGCGCSVPRGSREGHGVAALAALSLLARRRTTRRTLGVR
jgi:MYXO-CTERM domain-containing protein